MSWQNPISLESLHFISGKWDRIDHCYPLSSLYLFLLRLLIFLLLFASCSWYSSGSRTRKRKTDPAGVDGLIRVDSGNDLKLKLRLSGKRKVPFWAWARYEHIVNTGRKRNHNTAAHKQNKVPLWPGEQASFSLKQHMTAYGSIRLPNTICRGSAASCPISQCGFSWGSVERWFGLVFYYTRIRWTKISPRWQIYLQTHHLFSVSLILYRHVLKRRLYQDVCWLFTFILPSWLWTLCYVVTEVTQNGRKIAVFTFWNPWR